MFLSSAAGGLPCLSPLLSSVQDGAREDVISRTRGIQKGNWDAQTGSESHRQPITEDGGLPNSEDPSFGVSGVVPNSYIKATISRCQNTEIGNLRFGKYQRVGRI